MSRIKHVGNHFILGKQGREVAKISEMQLLECMEILRVELEENIYEVLWPEVIEYLQDKRSEKIKPKK